MALLGSNPPLPDAPRPGLRATIVIAADGDARERICRALPELESCARLRFEAPDGIGELALDESAIVVFACDVDSPRAIAQLRRLCRETLPAPVIAVSPPTTVTGVRRAIEAGAAALVFEPELEQALGAAIGAAASGQAVVPRSARAGVERPSLSHREREVLGFVRQGLTNAEIARRLFLAESTVKSHLASAYSKFGVHSRREATQAMAELERPLT